MTSWILGLVPSFSLILESSFLIKKMSISHFISMVDKAEKMTLNWRHSNISPTGKNILINSSILATPLYYLSIHAILDSILDKISKFSRRFFWSKRGDRKGISSISWRNTTLDQYEWGVLIKNLKLSKTSLWQKLSSASWMVIMFYGLTLFNTSMVSLIVGLILFLLSPPSFSDFTALCKLSNLLCGSNQLSWVFPSSF